MENWKYQTHSNWNRNNYQCLTFIYFYFICFGRQCESVEIKDANEDQRSLFVQTLTLLKTIWKVFAAPLASSDASLRRWAGYFECHWGIILKY